MFGPLYAASGNYVLSTNLCVLLLYMSTAAAMAALVARWGAGLLPATVAGILCTLGTMRVPVNLHAAIQHPSLWLVLIWLAYDASRGRPLSRGLTCAIGAPMFVGIFWSFYSAGFTIVLLACLVVQCWMRNERRKAAQLVCLAAVMLSLLAVFLIPYVLRAPTVYAPTVSAGSSVGSPWEVQYLLLRYFGRFLVDRTSWVTIFLLLLTLPLVLRRWRTEPRVRLALALVAIGTFGAVLLGLPFIDRATQDLPSIFQWPIRAFRYRWRLVHFADVGGAALAGYGLHLLLTHARLRPSARAVVLVGILVAIGYRASGLGAYPISEVPRTAPAHTWVAEHGAGEPVLEWPYPNPFTGSITGDVVRQADAMLRSTVHWTRILNGYTGYPPPWRKDVARLARRIGDPKALRLLVEATHVRWIIWPRDWRGPQLVARSPSIRPVAEFEESIVYRVNIDPKGTELRERLRAWDARALHQAMAPSARAAE